MILIAGPCAIESRDLTLKIAEHLSTIVRRFRYTTKIDFYFKASFDKANRSSGESPRGVGQQEGLKILEEVALQIGVQTLTDIHHPYQASLAAQVVDVLQIPAFLCRQTDLLEAAVATKKIVNVKKGQFLAPWDMEHVAGKLKGADFWFTERGTCFGYNRLVNDMTGIPTMKQ